MIKGAYCLLDGVRLRDSGADVLGTTKLDGNGRWRRNAILHGID